MGVGFVQDGSRLRDVKVYVGGIGIAIKNCKQGRVIEATKLGTLLADQEVEPTRNVQHMLNVATTDAWSQEKYAGAFDSSEGFASTLPGPVCRPLPLLGVAPCLQGLRQRLSHYHRLNG